MHWLVAPFIFKARKGQSFSHCITRSRSSALKEHSPNLMVRISMLILPCQVTHWKLPGIRTQIWRESSYSAYRSIRLPGAGLGRSVRGAYRPLSQKSVGILIFPPLYLTCRDHSDFSETDTWKEGVTHASGGKRRPPLFWEHWWISALTRILFTRKARWWSLRRGTSFWSWMWIKSSQLHMWSATMATTLCPLQSHFLLRKMRTVHTLKGCYED